MLFDEYKERLERRGRHASTINGYSVAVQRFLAWCDEHGIDASAPEPVQLEEYFDGLPFKRSTKFNHLKQLRAAYRYGMSRGVTNRDPTIDVELPREQDVTPRIIPNGFLRTSKEACRNEQEWLLFHVAAYTGARQFEITKMKWEDVLLPLRTVEIIGKGGKRRLVPIHPALGECLSPLGSGLLFPGRGGALSNATTMRYRLHRFCPEYSFHDFRRTVASSLDANGVEEGLIWRIMGWSARSVFDRHYRNVASERLQRAILMLYANDPL